MTNTLRGGALWVLMLGLVSPFTVEGQESKDGGVVEVADDAQLLLQEKWTELSRAVRRVALTFDDLPVVSGGPGPAAAEHVTESILASLEDFQAPAIGFVNEGKFNPGGLGVDRGRAMLEAWLAAGHALGNHTYSHMWMYESGPEAFIRDLERGEEFWRPMMEARGPYVPYLRHPRLNTGRTDAEKQQVEDYLEQAGYAIAPVTIDNNEYLYAAAYARALERDDVAQAARIADEYIGYMESIFAYYEDQSIRIVGREPAHILLLHANRLNADHLPALLSMIAGRGYEFITMDEALKDEIYDSEDGFVGRAGITWLHRWAITAGIPGSTFRGEPTVPDWVLEAARR